MNLAPRVFSLLVVGLVAFAGTGCGKAPVAGVRVAARASQVVAQGVPPQSAFVTVAGKVSKLLPDDNNGLPHQNFMVTVADEIYTVNNDTKFGAKVPNLAVGATLEIRGTVYHNGSKSGIHWTHHADKPGDAGYIKTADGKTYE